MTPSEVILNGIRSTLTPNEFDPHEEKLLKEKTQVWKEEVYPFLRSMVCPHLSGKGNASKRREFRLRLDAKAKEEESKSQQGEGKEITCETAMADGFVDIQNDE